MRLLRNALNTQPDDLFLKTWSSPEWQLIKPKLTELVG
jgi:hypothetical protein